MRQMKACKDMYHARTEVGYFQQLSEILKIFVLRHTKLMWVFFPFGSPSCLL